MKTPLIIIALVLVGGLGAWTLFGGKGELPNAATPQEQGAPSSAGKSGSLSVDKERCMLQPNGAYICSPDALSAFGPYTITDTASGNTCTASYAPDSGFVFSGPKLNSTIPPVDLAVALLADGTLSNIATTGISGSLALHVGANGTVDHMLMVGANYVSDQCLTI